MGATVAPPETALQFLWRVVASVRWRGIYPQLHQGLVADIFSVYCGFRIYHVSKVSAVKLHVEVATDDAAPFALIFPEAEVEREWGRMVSFRLPIPPEGRKEPRGE